MRLEELDGRQLTEIEASLRSIRHDLGKYICFEQRFIVSDDDVEELRRALRSDLQKTRRSGDSSEDCYEVWSRIRPDILDGDL